MSAYFGSIKHYEITLFLLKQIYELSVSDIFMFSFDPLAYRGVPLYSRQMLDFRVWELVYHGSFWSQSCIRVLRNSSFTFSRHPRPPTVISAQIRFSLSYSYLGKNGRPTGSLGQTLGRVGNARISPNQA